MKKSPLVQVMVKASIANAFGSGLRATYFPNFGLFLMQTGQPLTLDIFYEWSLNLKPILYHHFQPSILGLLHCYLSLDVGGTEVYVPVNAPEPHFSCYRVKLFCIFSQFIYTGTTCHVV